MKTILLIALVFSAILTITQALSCLPCDQVTCPSLSELQCQGGLTRDPCACCTACAKLRGEKCGGPWNVDGVCDCGLRCFKGLKEANFNAIGVCVRRYNIYVCLIVLLIITTNTSMMLCQYNG